MWTDGLLNHLPLSDLLVTYNCLVQEHSRVIHPQSFPQDASMHSHDKSRQEQVGRNSS